MSRKGSRAGGKFTKSHSTVAPAAGVMADVAERRPEVTKIAIGFLKSGLRPVNGHKRIKFTPLDGLVRLAIRDNISHQEITVYSSDTQLTAETLARQARDRGFDISFQATTQL